MIELNSFVNGDCVDGMAQFPDKYFELAIVDPVFGELVTQGGYMNNKGGGVTKQKSYNNALWQQPKTSREYFNELFRVSKNQIVWGGNYFTEEISKNSSCWIVWDKMNGENHFADCELAWTSFETATRIFRYRWAGMLQEDMKEKEARIHPTQKPVKLYEWILNKYAHAGDKILDTHVGSASSLIACHNLHYDYIGFELDPDYYRMGSERLESAKSQMKLL